MSKKLEKEKAIKLRLEGKSYSQIRNEVKVSKSTLSKWLHFFPLSNEKIRELRDNSQIRIEKCRNTKENNKRKKLENVYNEVGRDIGRLSEREIKLCGLFLYWGEGTKVASSSVVLSNTDPAMVLFFLKFLITIKVPKDKIFVRLQLYKDMDIEEEVEFWSNLLKISKENFKKPYIKKSNLTDITYKSGFGHGTCSLMVYDMVLYNKIISSLKYIKDSVMLRKN
jgi:hypothetical protein